jgi:D-arginine dehydrogenase
MHRVEVVIIGTGIAGASLAYFLAERGVSEVVLLEREEAPGSHATGRSAAVLCQLDPNSTVQRLIVASAPFLRRPPAGFSESPILTPSGVLLVFREPIWSALAHITPWLESEGIRLELLSPTQAVERVEVLNPEEFTGAVLLSADGRLDVHELLSSYLRHARRRGAELRTGVQVTGVLVERGRCVGVATSRGEVRARWVVNAAGAWAGAIARLAGAALIDVIPRRRCAVVYATPEGLDVSGWPLVGSDTHKVYFEPEAGGLLMSPMDEEPSEPCDARPDDLAIAEGFERLAALAPRLVPRSIKHKWAGLRMFAPDGVPLVGEDQLVPGFFWLAAQGGSGIETSPTLGAVAADLLLDSETDRFDASLLSPRRFA